MNDRSGLPPDAGTGEGSAHGLTELALERDVLLYQVGALLEEKQAAISLLWSMLLSFENHAKTPAQETAIRRANELLRPK